MSGERVTDAEGRREAGIAALVLYDGVCGLCDGAVQFLLRHDRRGTLVFAPLQGETARPILAGRPLRESALATMIFVRGHGTPSARTYAKSDAWIEILRELGGAWRIAAWVRVIPPIVRDFVYGWVARNRYVWFGRYDQCRIPSPAQRARFLA